MSEEDLPEKESAKPLIHEPASRGSVGKGIGLVLLLHLLQIPAAAMMGTIILPVICVTQFVYVLPAYIIARRKGHEDTAKGMTIAASITALLNFACAGVVFYSFDWAGS
ncbi:MAG: hypothetical protein AABO57_11990 [Acidobacteriota bacterium]